VEKRKLVKHASVLRNYKGSLVAALGYHIYSCLDAPCIAAASSFDDLCDLIAEDSLIDLNKIKAEQCCLIWGVVHEIEDLPYELDRDQTILVYLNGIEAFEYIIMTSAIAQIEYFIRQDPSKDLSCMVAIVGWRKTKDAVEVFLNRAHNLRFRYEHEKNMLSGQDMRE
jgi:hypothetical protein